VTPAAVHGFVTTAAIVQVTLPLATEELPVIVPEKITLMEDPAKMVVVALGLVTSMKISPAVSVSPSPLI
jgi:hypothetical protein